MKKKLKAFVLEKAVMQKSNHGTFREIFGNYFYDRDRTE